MYFRLGCVWLGDLTGAPKQSCFELQKRFLNLSFWKKILEMLALRTLGLHAIFSIRKPWATVGQGLEDATWKNCSSQACMCSAWTPTAGTLGIKDVRHISTSRSLGARLPGAILFPVPLLYLSLFPVCCDARMLTTYCYSHDALPKFIGPRKERLTPPKPGDKTRPRTSDLSRLGYLESSDKKTRYLRCVQY